MGNRLTRKSTGLSSGSTYQSNLSSIGINGISSIVNRTGIHGVLQEDADLYRADLPESLEAVYREVWK